MQAVLYLVSELRHYRSRNISRALCHEEYRHALRSYQLDYLLYLLEQALRSVLEKQMRFIKEEHHLRLLRVSHLRQHLKQLRQQIEHECRIQPRLVDQRLRVEYVDDAPSVRSSQEKIPDVYCRLAEESIRAFGFESDYRPYDGRSRLLRYEAVIHLELGGMISAVLQCSLHVFRIRKYEALIVGDLEDHLHQLCLCVVEIEHLAEKHRAHLRYCGAQRCPLFRVYVEYRDREASIIE